MTLLSGWIELCVFVFYRNGEPGSQLVSEKWGLSWIAYLVSQKNYIVVEIDGRGTGFQGESIRHAIYRSLGTLEVTDQIEALRSAILTESSLCSNNKYSLY